MRPIHSFDRWFTSTVSIAARSSVDRYDKPTYGSATSYRAHIARSSRIIAGSDGQQLVSAIQVYINEPVSVLPTAQITLSTGDVGSTESYDRQPRILDVCRRFDENGPHHTVIHCGAAVRGGSI